MDYDSMQGDIERCIGAMSEDSNFVDLDDTRSKVSQYDYDADMDRMKKHLYDLKTNPDRITTIVVQNIRKRKDGLFAKGSVYIIDKYTHTAYLSEEEYGYRYMSLRAKAISNDTVEILFYTDIEQW
jgi:hypothetical protein